MSEDVYLRLRSFLQQLPTGYPEARSGVELKILKKLFSEVHAELATLLTQEPQTVSQIAAGTDMDESELAGNLEDMAVRGLIFRIRREGKKLYSAYQFLIGIYEFQLPYIDLELARMMDEYFPWYGMQTVTSKTQTHQMRILPVGSSVNTKRNVAPYNQIRELVRDQELIVVNECICRKAEDLKGKHCERPREVCFSLGDHAQYSLDNGSGRRITPEEAVEILELADKSSLILSPSNTKELAYICCCCSCCCPLYKSLGFLPQSAKYVNSYYYATIDADLCSGCGTCLERCQMAAIKQKDDILQVDLDRCIGCGLCVSTCPEEAIEFIEKDNTEEPPQDITENLRRISVEKEL